MTEVARPLQGTSLTRLRHLGLGGRLIGGMDVFFSYSRRDLHGDVEDNRARRVWDILIQHGWEVYRDEKDIRPIDGLSPQLGRAIRKAGCTILVWSQSASESRWIVDEGRQARDLGKLVMVRIDDTPIPPELQPANFYIRVGERGGDIEDLDLRAELRRAVNYTMNLAPDVLVTCDAPTSVLRTRVEEIFEDLSSDVWWSDYHAVAVDPSRVRTHVVVWIPGSANEGPARVTRHLTRRGHCVHLVVDGAVIPEEFREVPRTQVSTAELERGGALSLGLRRRTWHLSLLPSSPRFHFRGVAAWAAVWCVLGAAALAASFTGSGSTTWRLVFATGYDVCTAETMPDGVQVVGWLWELVPLSLLAWFTVAFVGVFFGREAAWLFGLWNTPGYIWGYVRVFRAFFWVGGLLFLAFILYYHAWGGPLGLLRVGACLRQSDTAVAPILFVTEYQLPYALYLPYSLANYLAFGWPLAWVVGLGSVVDLLKARRRQIKWRAKLELGLVAQGTAGDGAIGRYLARQQMAFVETLERYAPVLTALAVLVVFTATFGAPSLSTAGQGITLVTLGVFLLAFLGLAQMALGHLKERDDLLREHPAEDPAAIRSQFSAWSYVRAILKEAPVNALAIGSSVLFMLWWLTTSNWAGIDRCSECPQPRHPHPSTVFAEVVQFAQELARAGGTARRER